MHAAALRKVLCAGASRFVLTWSAFAVSSDGLAQDHAKPAETAAAGALFLHGGGRLAPEARERFLELAGGTQARIVVIPTSEEGEIDPARWTPPAWLRESGCAALTVLHTRDRAEADNRGFAAPLRGCTAVWFTGGRQWRSTDVYLHTQTHRELLAAHRRGAVIGGTSAGATLLGSFLLRGAPEGNHVLVAEGRSEAFGLLPSSAIDQHLFSRGRERDLLEVVRSRPELLGIGIDENTSLLVHGGVLSMLGEGRALLYEARNFHAPGSSVPWQELRPGDLFDLERRVFLPRAVRH